ncbi:hypothetical protein ElyMa_000014000 [Elysia marginata]|uniref:Uncharacterized protein n=1 Tax=Elysia marginata TaxID=1093978 RepID=A0AAV4EB51_9GAST|nr:hypothetical protein ElyMa_000014000 [Elysia marginata]
MQALLTSQCGRTLSTVPSAVSDTTLVVEKETLKLKQPNSVKPLDLGAVEDHSYLLQLNWLNCWSYVETLRSQFWADPTDMNQKHSGDLGIGICSALPLLCP